MFMVNTRIIIWHAVGLAAVTVKSVNVRRPICL